MPPEESWEIETLPARLKELCVAGGGGEGGKGGAWGTFSLGWYLWPLRTPTSSQSILWPNNCPCLSHFSVREKETCDDFNLTRADLQDAGGYRIPPTLFLKLCNI